MLRSILAIVAGYALWTALWLGGNAVLTAEVQEVVAAGEPFTSPGPLAIALTLSVVCSLAGGVAAGALSKKHGAVLVLGILLLATGIAVQASYWELMPAWYHFVFLGLLVPVTRLGGSLGGARVVHGN